MAKSVPDPDFVLRDLTNSPITCVACIHQEIVCGTQDGHILVWHKKRRRVKHQIIAHAGHSVLWIGAVQSSNDLISQGRDGYMHLWKATEAGYTKQGKERDGYIHPWNLQREVTQNKVKVEIGTCTCGNLQRQVTQTKLDV